MKIEHKSGIMTEVHKAMYETLLAQYEAYPDQDFSMGQKELVEAVNDQLGYQALNYVEKPSHGDHCATLGQLAKDLNNSTEVDKIVLLDNYRFRLATEQEAIEYANKLEERGKRYLAMTSMVRRKIKRDGQGDMMTDQFHDTFVKGD